MPQGHYLDNGKCQKLQICSLNCHLLHWGAFLLALHLLIIYMSLWLTNISICIWRNTYFIVQIQKCKIYFYRNAYLYSARTQIDQKWEVKTFTMLQKNYILIVYCSFILSIHQRILDQNESLFPQKYQAPQRFSTLIIIKKKKSWGPKHHIRMISEGSCDILKGSYDAFF